MKINPTAAVSATLALSTVMELTSHKVPDWMRLLALGAAVSSLAYHASQVIEKPQNMGDCGCGCGGAGDCL